MLYDSLCVYWKWPRRFHRLQLILALLSCFLINLSVGLSNSVGNLLPYVVSYIRRYSQPHGMRITDSVFVYFIHCFSEMISMFLGGFMVKWFGPRVTSILGGTLFVAGVSLCYFTINISVYLFLVTYGLLFGAGCGLVFISSITCAVNWLPTRKGLAMAISTSGFGSGPLLYNAIITGYVNPHNESPNYSPFPDSPNELYYTQHYILMRVRTLFLVLAMVGGSMIAVSCVFLVNPHPSYGVEVGNHSSTVNEKVSETAKQPHNQQFISSKKGAKKIENFEMLKLSQQANKPASNGNMKRLKSGDKHLKAFRDVGPLQMMSTFSFYLLWLKSLLGCAIAGFTITLYKAFALQMVTADDFYIAFAGTLAALFNMIGRFSFGLLEDFIDVYFALSLQNAIMTSLLFTFYATSAGGEVMFLFWVSATFFCAGGYFSLYPSAVANRFGTKNMSVNFGIINTSCIVGELFTAVVSHFLIHRIEWYGAFFLFGGISFLDFILSIVYWSINTATGL